MDNPSLKLQYNATTSVTVNLFGATITSWISGGQEQLFLSKNAVFDNKKAIRGGIPVVFPHFGPWEKGPQHGFARISQWSVTQAPQVGSGGAVVAILLLEDSEYTRSMWEYGFELAYTIELCATSLCCQLSVKNRDCRPFDFTCLLHTYFLLPDVHDLVIRGLQGSTFVDKVNKGTFVEDREEVTVSESVDRVYADTPDELLISAKGRKMWKLIKQNMPDTVLWNPWAANAKAMTDFGDDEYLSMVCVEPGHVSSPVILQPGSCIVFTQTIIARE